MQKPVIRTIGLTKAVVFITVGVLFFSVLQQVFLDKKILRFSPLEEDRLLLVFVTYSMAEAMSAMQVFMDGNLTVLASMSTEDGYESLEMMYDKMREKVGDNGNQHLSGIQV